MGGTSPPVYGLPGRPGADVAGLVSALDLVVLLSSALLTLAPHP
jgi:hypothetical protein